ncbi:MAG: nucleotidyltransferase domain-containing protein [Deltaproteobacteria bacterium]|nr:nucleotidyltransferase domain-containing protein [Deltaproteobacteria bacterium]
MMDEVIVVGGPAPVSFERLRERIAAYLAGTAVERAVVFGSWARGEQDASSDLDLVLVEETASPFVERGRTHMPLFGMGVGIDLIVYTPGEYERLLDGGHPFVTRVAGEGVVIYARSGG